MGSIVSETERGGAVLENAYCTTMELGSFVGNNQ